MGLGFLQVGPSEESSSDSITIALPLQGSGVGDDWTVARGAPGMGSVAEGAAVATARARGGNNGAGAWR